ncbi:MAG: two-component system OmpR family sensor kinase [Sulfurimonas sp.]|jgi:two-component system OmpR family sensor kinase|uniref:ArsS family sensor histidine kinase n=1 Tax=Sulfurimonas sp. TaxID=2022749 RepID=UPI0039E496BD
MNKSSIFFSITITFVALFVFIIISFGVLYKGSQKREELFNYKRSFDIAHSIKKELRRERVITQELEEYISLMDFRIVKDKDKVLGSQDKHLKWEKHGRGQAISSFELDGKNYLHLQNRRIDMVLLDTTEPNDFRTIIIFVFLSMLVAFSLLYFNTIRKLKPLRKLKENIKNIGEEDFDIICASTQKDEISQLSNEFDKSAKKLKALKESRNVFIRNIMHELKTPITKGQFLAQLPSTDENKQSMQKVFYRLESLINEFASIEELISTKNEIQKKEYYLSDIIDNASDLLMSGEENIHKEFEDMQIEVDFKLFSIAVKNLMDNGIKYSSDKQVTIKTQGSFIIFENKGEELTSPLEKYFEAFSKSQDSSSSQSFGLGLYIVKHILDANQLSLSYEYENGMNRFIISK